MANYEFMFIVNPALPEAEINDTVASIKDTLAKNSGKVEKEDIWGEKKLAYKIKGSDKGYYGLYDLELDGTKIKEINSTLNLNTNIWRYMFVRKDA